MSVPPQVTTSTPNAKTQHRGKQHIRWALLATEHQNPLPSQTARLSVCLQQQRIQTKSQNELVALSSWLSVRAHRRIRHTRQIDRQTDREQRFAGCHNTDHHHSEPISLLTAAPPQPKSPLTKKAAHTTPTHTKPSLTFSCRPHRPHPPRHPHHPSWPPHGAARLSCRLCGGAGVCCGASAAACCIRGARRA